MLKCVGLLSPIFWDNFPTEARKLDKLGAILASLDGVEHYGAYRTQLRFDAQVWGPTTEIRIFTVTQNQKFRRRVRIPKPP